MTELIGSIFDRKYRLTRLIGEGGMSTVYEAEHTLIDRKVAVKVMHRQFTGFQEMVDRFFREAQASSAIGHPNIIEIFDVGTQDDGTAFMVMELLNGQSLSDWMKNNDGSSPETAVAIILQVLSALVAAHEKGIVHRDLKPDNIFLAVDSRGRDEVKLLDFGIAKIQTELEGDQGLTKTGTVLGTPNYMSPEQARGRPVDHRIDIWAAGVILYQMLCRRLPFSGESYNEVLSEILLEKPEPIRELAPDIPDDLAAIVEKAMAKDREDRYQSVAAMIEELAPFAGSAEDLMTDTVVRALRNSIIPPSGIAGITRSRTGTSSIREDSISSKTAHSTVREPRTKKRRVVIPYLLTGILALALFGFVLYSRESDKPLHQVGVALVEDAISFWGDNREGSSIEESLRALAPIKTEDSTPENRVAEQPDVNSGDKTPGPDAGIENDKPSSESGQGIEAEKHQAPEPVVPKQVTIKLKDLPKRAKVTVDGKRMKPPLKLKGSKEPVKLRVTLKRHEPFEVEIIPDSDQEVEPVLKKKRRGGRRRK